VRTQITEFFQKNYQLLVYGPVHHLPFFFLFGPIRSEINRKNWGAVLKVASIWKIPVPFSVLEAYHRAHQTFGGNRNSHWQHIANIAKMGSHAQYEQ
jgi:hypothetical protein